MKKLHRDGAFKICYNTLTATLASAAWIGQSTSQVQTSHSEKAAVGSTSESFEFMFSIARHIEHYIILGSLI